jgi:hypothetical protein
MSITVPADKAEKELKTSHSSSQQRESLLYAISQEQSSFRV